MIDRADIAIIGGGAAGLAAGIFAAESAPNRHIVILDSAKSVGAKILVSGGGRCNVTHDEVRPADFNGTLHIVRNILAAFPVEATCKWFSSLGVELKREDTGKLFPVTDHAQTVLSALLNRCQELGVIILNQHRVLNVVPPADQRTGHFMVNYQGGSLSAKQVILATGGRSLPRTGSDGSGWEIARQLGHTVTPTYPALVPLMLEHTMFHAELSGLSQIVELTTKVDGKIVDRRSGSLLWTHFGISGPVVMDASRFWTMARAQKLTVEMRCNFVPRVNIEQAERRMMGDIHARPRLTIAHLLTLYVPERMAGALCRHVQIDSATQAGQLSREARHTLVQALTQLTLPIAHDRGWNYAEVTAGGVPLEEINFRTMESKKTPGLYLIGELLDCDGRIGGFNFQWAWATGHIAGRAAATMHV